MNNIEAKQLLPPCPQAVHQLIHGLELNHELLTLAWAFWRAGRKPSAIVAEDGMMSMCGGRQTPLKTLLRTCYEAGIRGVNWPTVLEWARMDSRTAEEATVDATAAKS